MTQMPLVASLKPSAARVTLKVDLSTSLKAIKSITALKVTLGTAVAIKSLTALKAIKAIKSLATKVLPKTPRVSATIILMTRVPSVAPLRVLAFGTMLEAFKSLTTKLVPKTPWASTALPSLASASTHK